jgi:hypothetical protein
LEPSGRRASERRLAKAQAGGAAGRRMTGVRPRISTVTQ